MPVECLRLNTISLQDEMISYETLWGRKESSFKTIADMFRKHPRPPSEVLRIVMDDELFLEDLRARVAEYLEELTGFSVGVRGTFQYPEKLRLASHPVELFYYRGDIGYLESRCISIVGARKASPEGKRRAARLARELAAEDFTIVSGLAAGIDTAAMQATIDAGGRTVGVIGTPINQVYPKENSSLQEMVACRHLLMSQVPFWKYKHDHFKMRRFYFPERNQTMAALSEATIIVEASDTSGSLTQARACFKQGKKLFILNSCFENKSISWPAEYEAKGAIRVNRTADILEHLVRSSTT